MSKKTEKKRPREQNIKYPLGILGYYVKPVYKGREDGKMHIQHIAFPWCGWGSDFHYQITIEGEKKPNHVKIRRKVLKKLEENGHDIKQRIKQLNKKLRGVYIPSGVVSYRKMVHGKYVKFSYIATISYMENGQKKRKQIGLGSMFDPEDALFRIEYTFKRMGYSIYCRNSSGVICKREEYDGIRR